MEKIPILYTTFNRIGYTKETLPALIDSIGDEAEIYIVDNCSTDGTVEYLKNFKSKKIKEVIFNSKNQGVSGQ